jgi:hypothetical protein
MKKEFLILILILNAAIGVFAQADIKETLTLIKTNLASSKENLKKYEWIETTTTYLNGEAKSTKQNRCYYDVSGNLMKVATGGGSGAGPTKGGLRGKIIANKKEEMADYIGKAMKQVKLYLPPDAVKVQKIYDAGKSGFHVLEPGKKFKIDLPDYHIPGDMLSISVDKLLKQLTAVDVQTYLDSPADKVIFNLQYKTLPDGTQYPATTTLQANAKNIKIVIENSGYKLSSSK